jgi:RNA polymerase sigma-B factor
MVRTAGNVRLTSKFIDPELGGVVPPQLSSAPEVKRSAAVLRELDNGRAWKDRSLFQRYVDERDPVDRQLLIERFLPLARQLAGRYRRAAEPFDDRFQVACVGLIKAIDRFDLEREIAFSTFAVPTILGELRRYFRDRTWSVRVPRELQELTLKVDRAVSDLTLALQRAPTVGEIAASVAAEEAEVLEALHAAGAYRATSLDAPRGNGDDDSDDTLGDTLSADDNHFARAEDRATLARLARGITSREREILRLRFAEDLTEAEIGERIGLSQMQVSRIIRQALLRLQVSARDPVVSNASRRRPAA